MILAIVQNPYFASTAFSCFPIRAIAAGFVDRQGEIPQHTRTAMNSKGSAAEGFAAVTSAFETIRCVIKRHRLVAAANHGGACGIL